MKILKESGKLIIVFFLSPFIMYMLVKQVIKECRK